MIEPDDVGPADDALLDMLEEGRITAPFAAEETGYNTQYVRDRLGRLVEHGHARKVYQGLYELDDDPREDESRDDLDEALAGGPTDEGMDDEETAAAADRHMDARSDGVTVDEVRDQLRDMDLPGSGSRYDQRVEAVATIWQELQSNPGERMAKSDFAKVLDGEDVGYASFGSLWSNWVKSNPAQGHEGNVLESLPGVEMDGDAYVYVR